MKSLSKMLKMLGCCNSSSVIENEERQYLVRPAKEEPISRSKNSALSSLEVAGKLREIEQELNKTARMA